MRSAECPRRNRLVRERGWGELASGKARTSAESRVINKALDRAHARSVSEGWTTLVGGGGWGSSAPEDR